MSKTFELILDLIQGKDIKVSDHSYDELADEEKIMRKRHHKKLVHEGNYVAP